jgi:hypothetical protein
VEYDLCTKLEDFNVCTEFGLFEVKVPFIFLGTVGFSARRDRRYYSSR